MSGFDPGGGEDPEEPAAAPEAGDAKAGPSTRYEAGESGNRKGRPKGAKGRKQIVTGIAGESHLVTEEGKPQRRTTLELVLLALQRRALDGDIKAFEAVDRLLERYQPEQPAKQGAFLIVPPPVPVDEYLARVKESQRKGRGE
jgi:hypothetical protein